MKSAPPNQFRRRSFGPFSSTDEDGMNGAFSIPLGNKNIIANCIISDGVDVPDPYGGWEHVSAHIEDHGVQKTPTWVQMCQLKDIFWGPEEAVVQFHPPQSEYVNNHPHVLHLWKWTKGEFPRPSWLLVGIKGLGVIG